MKAILLSKDLMFISRVKEVAAVAGSEVLVVKNEVALSEAVSASSSQEQRGLIMLDLEKCPVELDLVQKMIASSASTNWRCVCFFSHVHVETAEDARSKGFNEVMPRSKFVQILPGLFT
ncbi:MAG: hypothetical protein ACK5GN_12265 [Pseudomonadota bacterium]